MSIEKSAMYHPAYLSREDMHFVIHNSGDERISGKVARGYMRLYSSVPTGGDTHRHMMGLCKEGD